MYKRRRYRARCRARLINAVLAAQYARLADMFFGHVDAARVDAHFHNVNRRAEKRGIHVDVSGVTYP